MLLLSKAEQRINDLEFELSSTKIDHDNLTENFSKEK